MSGTNRFQVPLQRLKDIDDPWVREHAKLGVQITLQANLSQLRSIKETELKWVQTFSIVTLPAIAYLMALGGESPILGCPIVLILLFYLLLTGSVQYILFRERVSYYRLLRSVVRGQNLLGLFDIEYLSPHFAAGAFPKGFGPRPGQDGTQPQSSFLRRQAYTLMLYVGVALAAGFRLCSVSHWLVAVAAVCPALDLGWLVYIFHRDGALMKTHTAGEEGLAGWDPQWSPSRQKGEVDRGGCQVAKKKS